MDIRLAAALDTAKVIFFGSVVGIGMHMFFTMLTPDQIIISLLCAMIVGMVGITYRFNLDTRKTQEKIESMRRKDPHD